MKNFIPFVASLLFVVLFSVACKKNCKHVTCGANATCSEGVCSCITGYHADANGVCVINNPCDTITCNAHEHCLTGTCVCDSGYVMDSATSTCVLARTRALGNWVVMEDCSNTNPQNYTVGITADTAMANQIWISNFQRTFANPVVAQVSADGNTITIASQQPDNDNFFVQGTGSKNGNSITFSYVVTDASVSPAATVDSCNASIWTK